MFIKLYLGLEEFKVFRADDIISIDPIFCIEGGLDRYELVLATDEIIGITTEQAHDLSIQLRPSIIHHPSQFE